MAHRSDEVEFVRSVGSLLVDEDITEKNGVSCEKSVDEGAEDGTVITRGEQLPEEDGDLPQCKIKRNYSCTLCPFFSQNPRSFLYHSRDVHFDRIKIHECSQCLYASKHSQKLQRHISMIHAPGKTRGRKKNRGIKADKRAEPRPIKPKPPDPAAEYSVKIVTQETQADLENLEAEAETSVEPLRTTDGEYVCSVCNFKHKNQKVVRRHERIVHLKKRFLKCGKCSYVTHVTARYTKHVKYHSMPMIKCDLCDFRTPYKWNLDRHYKNHNGKGEFQCSKCNFRADIKQSLTVHEMNHHVPPVGQGTARKRTRAQPADTKAAEPVGEAEVGCSAEKDEFDVEPIEEVETNEDETPTNLDNVQTVRNVKVPYVNKRETTNNHLQTDFIHPDDIVPRYGQIYVKNLKCKFCSYKAVFKHEIARHEKRIHDYIRSENKKENSLKRPPPKLIPIQNKNNPTAILKIPAVRNKPGATSPEPTPVDKPVNEKEFNEMCKKSSLTSSLKDFVSLIGDEEGLKSIPDSSRELEDELISAKDSEARKGEMAKQKQTDLLKKKNASFFDKLKEKLMTGNSEEQSLFCEVCGHESKCLSESVAHQKRHSSSHKSDSDSQNDIILIGELSSTRCQHCRQRCKTSTDLINHLKTCKAFEAAQGNSEIEVKMESEVKEEVDGIAELQVKEEVDGIAELQVKEEVEEKSEDNKSMENRVFVWNNLNHTLDDDPEMDVDQSLIGDDQNEELSTFPGYGTVTSKGSDNTESGTVSSEADPRFNFIVKKAFKCPHCPFWASTASRFHVHIVGHLNKKPFECSLCLYRSNWRWDITKHIRLKSIRDPTHLQAKVNMTDETGRRNYTKYNRFLTMMKVQEPSAESSGYGRRSRPNEITQGSASDKDIISLPAPPRLTRAPPPGGSYQVVSDAPLRPPPPLQAAHNVQTDTVKKTFWKCKKCHFRDTQKGRVLLHVKKHYMYKKNEKSSNLSSSSNDIDSADQDNSQSKSSQKSISYSCGHCHQVSKWKHVVQRHCMLKHNGDTLVEVNWNKKPEEDDEKSKEQHRKRISCDICPFTTHTEGDLTAHKLNHVDRPGSIFKCTYCPFYVPSKIAVFEHMEIHVESERCDFTNLKVDNFDPGDRNEEFSGPVRKRGQLPKRFKCRQCPYLSNSKTQFLYHKQFHKPRNAPYKCMNCSYNVYHRNLLYQHIRVHLNAKVEQSEIEPKIESSPIPSPEIKESDQCSETQISMERNFDESDIPQVWVVKSGLIKKMFKCRWCPYVNARKSNVTEHERVHQINDTMNTPPTKKSFRLGSGCKLYCPKCNYCCNNAGTLTSHMKITHHGYFGEIYALVDSNKMDRVQIKELMKALEKEENERTTKKVRSPRLENKTRDESQKPEEGKKVLSFCNKCPARFIFEKELKIHLKFHMIHLPFRCFYCTYTARQRPHLLSHYKVHSTEYQEKSVELMKMYPMSVDNPQPRTDIVTEDSCKIKMEGPVWVVPTMEGVKIVNGKQKHACLRCPATFFKYSAMRQHLSFHGRNNKYKCSYCDYSVKVLGILAKHQAIHEENTKKSNFMYSFPISGEDLDEESEGNTVTKPENHRSTKHAEFRKCRKKDYQDSWDLRRSWKNGKKVNKPFKCHKCPSTFEKRKKYEIHLSLHGAKQKYKCKQCDYSVNYHSNYLYHVRRHRVFDAKIIQKKPAKDEIKKSKLPFRSLENYTKTFRCKFCGYSSIRLEGLKFHLKRHFRVSGIRSRHICKYCDYSTAKSSLILKHNKLHFTPRFVPESIVKFEKMELWCQEIDKQSKTLIFQDRGEETENRFYPYVDRYSAGGEELTVRLYADPKTGNLVKEEEILSDDSILQADLMEMIEKEELDVRVRKRWRGKNWKCNKCPHAFSKKEHYLRHRELHGSNQKHTCDICDYSVKFYTNYVQHMRMHQRHEPERKINIRKNSCVNEVKTTEEFDDDSENVVFNERPRETELNTFPESDCVALA